MRIDAHQHFWNYNDREFDWINEEMLAIKRTFLPSDLEPILKSMNFNGTIAIQARQTLEETEFLLELAQEYDIIKGVVGWVDLCSPNVYSQLEKYAKNPYLKGIRHIVQDEPDEKFLLKEDFQNGLRLLKQFGLTYDLLIYPKHLPYAIELVEKFPEQSFVLDHLAKPYIKNQVVIPWQEHIQKLASFKNVFCKVSGMVTEANRNWKKSDFTPYLDVVFAAFGEERLMIGSDWPVCTTHGDYKSVIEIVLHYLTPSSSETKEKVLGKNCAKFYGIMLEDE